VDRRHPLAELIPLLVHEAPVERLDLRPLNAAATRAPVDARYDLAAGEAARLATYLIDQTEGNALFVTELLRTLEGEGLLHREDGRWHVRAIAQVPAPRLLTQIIDDRLTRLGDDMDALLAIAAVIGQEVPLSVWQAITQADEDTLLTVAERAEAAHLVSAWRSGAGIGFTHALVRGVLYEGVPAMRRRRLHRQVGEALLALPTPDPDAVAYHFQKASDARAAQWLVRAGERAQAAHAWLTAAERFEAALRLMEAHPTNDSMAGWLHYRLARMRRYSDPAGGIVHLDAAQRIALETGDRALAAGAQFSLALLRMHIAEMVAGLAELRAGVAALATLTDKEQERLNAHDDTGSGTMASRQGILVLYLAATGHVAEAVALGEAMVQGLPTDPDEIARVGGMHIDALRGLAAAYTFLGRVADSRATYARARAVARARGQLANLYNMLQAELWWVFLPYLTDDVAERERLLTEARAVWEQSRAMGMPLAIGMHDPSLALVTGAWDVAREAAEAEYANPLPGYRPQASGALAQLARAQGRVVEAQGYLREQFPAGPASEPGGVMLMWGLHALREAAALALDTGDLHSTKAWLAAHDRWMTWSGAVLGQSEGQVLWARYYRQAGDPQQARRHAARALAHATDPRQPLALLTAHRLLGILDSDAGHVADAEKHFTQALALADACAAPYERALILLAKTELAAAQGDNATANAALDEVRAICTPLDAQPALAHADRIASRLTRTSVPVAPNSPFPADLSAREVEVLRLIAAGLGNPAIAECLYLSLNTVRAHVANIFAKIGVTNRAAATRFALDHGLV
jgi:DNA-binding CsgD family transcriptional regulator/tetratricopeptide (TPR) repeat protein